MRTRAALLALASAAAVASLSGCGHASRSSAPLPQPPHSYSVREVKTAFAAAHLPLVETSSIYEGEPMFAGASAYLGSPAWVGLTVSVYPRSMADGPFVWSEVGPERDYKVSEVGNVVVVFDRRSPSAPRIRAALARLRRL